MKPQKQAGGIVVNPHGEVLLVTNFAGRRTIPKGSLRFYESRRRCAPREIGEESGITELTIHQDLGELTRPGFRGIFRERPAIKHIGVFLCSTAQTALRPRDSEIIEAGWFAQDVVPEILSWREEAAFFLRHQKQIGELALL